MKLITAVLTGLLFFAYCAPCQNAIGLQEITNYPKQVYNADSQNWDICQDENGFLYFANNDGLLSFDGTHWKVHPLPHKTIVRSVALGKNNKIYTGGQDELGYFSPNAAGDMTYHCLKALIPPLERSFEDVWDIVCINEQVFFRTNNTIFRLTGKGFTTYHATHWLFMGAAQGTLISQDIDRGLLVYTNEKWTPVAGSDHLPAEFKATAVVPAGKDSILITSLKHGIYLFTANRLTRLRSPAMQTLAEYQIYSASAIDDQTIALATTQQGCIIIDKNGNRVQQFSRKEGLQHNNVLSVFTDRDKNLWLGLNHGIDYVAYNSAVKHISPDREAAGAGYSALIFNNRLYLATTSGLYYIPLNGSSDISLTKGEFKMIEGSKGQAWNLSAVFGRLFMGHHEGCFEVADNKATRLNASTGFWTFLPRMNGQNHKVMVAGTYRGLSFYPFQHSRTSSTSVDINFESARFVELFKEHVWVSHPYKGVFRIQKDQEGRPSLKKYGLEQGLRTIGNYLFKIRDRLVVATTNGILEYDTQKDSFIPSAYFNRIFEKMPVRYLKEDPSGNIWFVFEKNLGVVDYSLDTPAIIFINELSRKMVSGFEQVYPVNEQNIFIGSENGYFHINFTKYKRSHLPINVYLTKVVASGIKDSVLVNGCSGTRNIRLQTREHAAISYRQNSLHFEFSSPQYSQQSIIQYSCLLKGFDHKWSEWTTKTEREYPLLPAGEYQFMVRSRSQPDNESAITQYALHILPPWYRSWWAYSFYTCLIIYSFFWYYQRQRKKLVRQRDRYEQRQKQLRDQHQLELEKNEKEIVKLRNEKLEAEINHKNKEMASAAMHLVKKGELITRIKDELQRLTKNTADENSLEAIKKITRALSDDDKVDEDWDHFTIHFDKAHNDFFVALKEKHNNLTPNELKLCAYLRMNLSTKEMAQLMNISVRGVEISRYRLRKKLQIPTETNLFNYLLGFSR